MFTHTHTQVCLHVSYTNLWTVFEHDAVAERRRPVERTIAVEKVTKTVTASKNRASIKTHLTDIIRLYAVT